MLYIEDIIEENNNVEPKEKKIEENKQEKNETKADGITVLKNMIFSMLQFRIFVCN